MDAIISTAKDYTFSVAKEEFKSVWYLKDEIDRISGVLATIQAQAAMMEAAEKKQLQDEEVRKWVRDLKNAAYDMEDVEWDYRAVVSSEDGQGVLTRLMRLAQDVLYLACGIPLSCLGIIPAPVITTRIEIAHRLPSINKKLVEIKQRMANLSLDGGMFGEANPAGPSLWQYQERPMIGRTETKIQMNEALLKYAVAGNEGSFSKLFVIGIVGAGGMGKTTLAHSIFNDEDVVAAFSNRKWVYVGDKFDMKRVMHEIIGENRHLVREDDLHSAMREKFRDQSLLIVLDDAWCEESVKWDLLQSSLSMGAKAHALIVTTRNMAVARAIPHESEYLERELLGLPDTECMEVFKRWAFMGEQAETYLHDLEGLSKQVVKKLKGNPLAATMMGTFLHGHLDNRTMWINVVSDWPHTNEGNVVDRVVGLSYLHLSPHLKLCFAYCALFYKGFIFDKKELVQMWIAQGYVQSPTGGLMEHSANFDDLYQRSFFQLGTVESRYGGGRGHYTMHDLIHDFAQKVFTEGCRMDASDTTEDGTPYEEIRHLSFHCYGTEPLKRLHNFKKLRTLTLGSYVTTATQVPLDVLAKFKYLRLLVLRVSQLSEFPDSIRHLRFLRYLDIQETGITALPEFVFDLVELQFLKLRWEFALPEGMNKLINLRFIDAQWKDVPQLKGIGMLTSLQGCGRHLRFRVENRSGWKISELKGLNHLHGKLELSGLRDVTCREEAEQACLTQKKYLEELVLDWTQHVDSQLKHVVESQEEEEEETVDVVESQEEETVDVVESQLKHVVESREEIEEEEEEEEEESEETADAVESQQVQQQHVRNEDVESQVLEGLFPPPTLKVLRIKNNRGPRFPSWMEKHDRCPISSSLVTLELDGCRNWECLSTLSRWPYLKELKIRGLYGVKKIGPEFFGGTDDGGRVYFPRLEILSLEDMGEWEEWEMMTATGEEIHSGGGGGGRHMFPSRLKHLIIIKCPKLASLAPILHHSTNLESLTISTCAELASLDGCGSTLPSGLKHLMVHDCPKLASLVPILRHHSTNLETVEITGCADQLGLSWEEGDDERRWMLPSGLKKLSIAECSWKLLPSLSHLTALQELIIWGFPNLRCIPPCLHSLRSLERLQIVYCPAIERLPDGGLPPSLRNLYIVQCPLLQGRCREGGPDRPKIPTTTTVYFDRVAIGPVDGSHPGGRDGSWWMIVNGSSGSETRSGSNSNFGFGSHLLTQNYRFGANSLDPKFFFRGEWR